MKVRTWADGQKQRKKLVPVDATSPTVSIESVLLSAAIDVHAVSNVMICGIPGAFLSADMDEEVKMALRGTLAGLLVNIAPQIYRDHVIYEK